jgi:hypothetical protein
MSGIDESALYQQAVVLIADRKGSSRLGAAKVILGHVILYSAAERKPSIRQWESVAEFRRSYPDV